jgi:conserved oligomeric Golgi complex subunit 4
MDELDLLSSPSLSSSLDDTFYILKKTLYRLLSTSNIETVVALSSQVRATVESGVVEVWRRRLEGAFVGVGTGGAGLGGRAKEEEKERKEREAKGVFMVRSRLGGLTPRTVAHLLSLTSQIYLNNLDTASGYTIRLIDELLGGEALQQAFFLEAELEQAKIAMLGVRGVEERFRGVCKVSLDLHRAALRPKRREDEGVGWETAPS